MIRVNSTTHSARVTRMNIHCMTMMTTMTSTCIAGAKRELVVGKSLGKITFSRGPCQLRWNCHPVPCTTGLFAANGREWDGITSRDNRLLVILQALPSIDLIIPKLLSHELDSAVPSNPRRKSDLRFYFPVSK